MEAVAATAANLGHRMQIPISRIIMPIQVDLAALLKLIMEDPQHLMQMASIREALETKILQWCQGITTIMDLINMEEMEPTDKVGHPIEKWTLMAITGSHNSSKASKAHPNSRIWTCTTNKEMVLAEISSIPREQAPKANLCTLQGGPTMTSTSILTKWMIFNITSSAVFP